MNRYRADTHVHTKGSGDSKESIENIAKRAEELSLDMITITDHCDVDFYKEFRCEEGMQFSYESVQEIKGKTSVQVLFGIELAQTMRDESFATKLSKKYNYDFVIASLHNVKGYKDFSELDVTSGAVDTDKLLERYYAELIDVGAQKMGDTIAHITYPLRYYYIQGIEYDINRYKEAIREMYRAIIENGTALECNTSGLRQAIGETFPNRELFALYKDVGGELITLGADSHTATDLYAGIDEAREMLKALGFVNGHYFINRKINSYKL